MLQQDLSLQLVWRRHCHPFLHRVRGQEILHFFHDLERTHKLFCSENEMFWLVLNLNRSLHRIPIQTMLTIVFHVLHLEQHVAKNLLKVGCHFQLLHPGWRLFISNLSSFITYSVNILMRLQIAIVKDGNFIYEVAIFTYSSILSTKFCTFQKVRD